MGITKTGKCNGGTTWHTGIAYPTKTRLFTARRGGFRSELNGPVVVTQPPDREKLAAYRAQPKTSKRRRYV